MCHHYTTVFPETGIFVNLHGLNLRFWASDDTLCARFRLIYGHLPGPQAAADQISIVWELISDTLAPPPPPDSRLILQDKLISYYERREQDELIIRLPKYARLTINLTQKKVIGQVTCNCLEVYGAFEDVLIIALAPLYRRRGWFPLHAFAALAPSGQAVLISGVMGSGKTTTGLALLGAGWKLLSNDSPLLTIRSDRVYALAYPGQLSAFDDSLARFERLRRFIPLDASASAPREKRVFRAEEAFTAPWAEAGPVGAVFFPEVVSGLSRSQLIPASPQEAMLALIPQALDHWDRPMTRRGLQLLKQLVGQARCYFLKLSPHVEELPALLSDA